MPKRKKRKRTVIANPETKYGMRPKRLSFRVPVSVDAELRSRASKTGLPISDIVVDVLQRELCPPTAAGIFE